MDDFMNCRSSRQHGAVQRALWLGILVTVSSASALAQGPVADPTRPPAEALLLPSPGETVTATGPRLQSVLVSARPGGRRVAVIDGQTVRLGGKFDGAVLVKVSDQAVVLRRGNELQTLRLYPAPLPGMSPPASAAGARAPVAATTGTRPPPHSSNAQ